MLRSVGFAQAILQPITDCGEPWWVQSEHQPGQFSGTRSKILDPGGFLFPELRVSRASPLYHFPARIGCGEQTKSWGFEQKRKLARALVIRQRAGHSGTPGVCQNSRVGTYSLEMPGKQRGRIQLNSPCTIDKHKEQASPKQFDRFHCC
jgi:hypothetical protein